MEEIKIDDLRKIIRHGSNDLGDYQSVREITVKYMLCDIITTLNCYLNYLNTCIENLKIDPFYLHDKFCFNDIAKDFITDSSSNKGYDKIINIKCNFACELIIDGNSCKPATHFRLCRDKTRGKWNIIFRSDSALTIEPYFGGQWFNYYKFENELDNNACLKYSKKR